MLIVIGNHNGDNNNNAIFNVGFHCIINKNECKYNMDLNHFFL